MTDFAQFRCADCSTPAVVTTPALFGTAVAVVHDAECPAHQHMTAGERAEYRAGVLLAHVGFDQGHRIEWQIDSAGRPHLAIVDLEAEEATS